MAGIIGMLGSLLGCVKNNDPDSHKEAGNQGNSKPAAVNESGISDFRYSYNGSVGGGGYTYEVSEEEHLFSYIAMDYFDYGVMTCEADAELLASLNDLYLEKNIAAWNGFDETDPEVLDGDGFNLTILFQDGSYLHASGMNAFPEGYRDAVDRMDEIFRPYRERVLDEKKEAIAEKGITGKLDSMVICFKQQGSSGSDSYRFMIQHQSLREYNYTAEVNSESGEFIEKGSYKVAVSAPDEELPFDEVQKLIEKYEVIR